jgi:hypothetical protein
MNNVVTMDRKPYVAASEAEHEGVTLTCRNGEWFWSVAVQPTRVSNPEGPLEDDQGRYVLVSAAVEHGPFLSRGAAMISAMRTINAAKRA